MINNSHIATILEELRRARNHARDTDNAADWARVDAIYREISDHAETYLWALLAENKSLRMQVKARDAARIVKGGE